ncbi:hypothetical protein ACTFIU_008718 [Dictyostelium citrinum]
MDNIIYSYLNDLYNDYSNNCGNNDYDLFLKCLLALSINDLYITYDTLSHYCNIVNSNNRKRYDPDFEDSLYCLNDKQIQVLNNHIKILNNNNNSNNNKNNNNNSSDNEKYIFTHPKTYSNNNNDQNKITFDCSIVIIIQNNIKLQKKQFLNKTFNKKIKTTDNDNGFINVYKIYNKNNSNNNYNNKNKYKYKDKNYELFKKVWNNIIIKKNILFHLRLYNFHMIEKFKISIEELENYKYKSYITTLIISGDETKYPILNRNYKIPSSVTRLEFSDSFDPILEDYCIPNTITSLRFGMNFDQKLNKKIISDSITSLCLNYSFNQTLGGDGDGSETWIPKEIKHLEFGESFQQSIYPGQLPHGLTSLILDENYGGIIAPNSIPDTVKTLNFTFESNENTWDLKNGIIPKGTTSLEFDNSFNQPINIGDIPPNVTNLKFGDAFNNIINPNSLPHSIRTLTFGTYYNNKLKPNSLPPNLTCLTFGYGYNQPLEQDQIPRTVCELSFGGTFDQAIPSGFFRKYKCLKSLNFDNSFDQVIPPESLPRTITSLNLGGYDGTLNKQMFPPSLKSLTLGSFNQSIKEGDLPSSITSLTLSSFNHSIKNNVLPQSLTHLELGNFFNNTIEREALPSTLKSFTFLSLHCKTFPTIEWPSSLETISLAYNTNLLNSLDSKLFDKYKLN